jgi:predicted N-acetyltransferase YhbS
MHDGTIAIRTYQDSDYAAVVALWNVVFPKDPPWNEPAELIRRKRSVQPNLFWIAQDGDEIVGTVLAGYDGVRGWIYHLVVDPAKRRKGTARLLMKTAEDGLEALAGCGKTQIDRL